MPPAAAAPAAGAAAGGVAGQQGQQQQRGGFLQGFVRMIMMYYMFKVGGGWAHSAAACLRAYAFLRHCCGRVADLPACTPALPTDIHRRRQQGRVAGRGQGRQGEPASQQQGSQHHQAAAVQPSQHASCRRRRQPASPTALPRLPRLPQVLSPRLFKGHPLDMHLYLSERPTWQDAVAAEQPVWTAADVPLAEAGVQRTAEFVYRPSLVRCAAAAAAVGGGAVACGGRGGCWTAG